ncbi:MAG: hypothetical protein WCO19_03815 [Candidatus Saccharibacteria bacterium]
MKSNEKGFGVLGVFLIICIIVTVCGVGYFVWNANKKTSDTSNTGDSSQTSTKPSTDQVIETIKKGLEAINSGSTVIEKGNAVSEYIGTLENDGSLIIPSDVYANYGQELAKTSADAAKLVMTDNDLIQTKDSSTSSGPEYEYGNADLECKIFGTDFFTRVKCATKTRIAEYTATIPEIEAVVSKKLGVEFKSDGKQTVNFFVSGDLTGATFTAMKVGTDKFMQATYLSSSDKKSWKYIGQDTFEDRQTTPAACNLFSAEENALFKRTFCK